MKKKDSILLVAGGVIALSIAAYMLARNKTPNSNMNTTLPRGYRNNNPLNIRYSRNNTWIGKVMPNTDGAFEQFQSMAYGYRAALYLIRKYIASGATTIQAIVSKWAPETENNTQRYIQRVCNTTGYQPTTTINAYNKEQMCRLVYAMAIVENGNVAGYPDMQTIEQGYNLL